MENLQETLSINHNWLNRNNLHWGWVKIYREIQHLLASTETLDPKSQVAAEFIDFWTVISTKAAIIFGGDPETGILDKLADVKAIIGVLEDLHDMVMAEEGEVQRFSAFRLLYDPSLLGRLQGHRLHLETLGDATVLNVIV